MPWCPNCSCEYVDGIKACSDCLVPLVDAYPEEEPQEPGAVDLGKPVFLLTADDEMEAGMVEQILWANGILSFRKYPGAGEYLTLAMGNTYTGIEFYMPESMHGQAVDLLQFEEIDPEADIEALLESENEE